MSTDTDVRLTPAQRFSRGLKYTVVGPVDLTRGTIGLGLSSAATSASWIGRQIRESEPVVEPSRGRRPLIYILIGSAVLAVGAVTFSIVRRSMRPDPSTLPPSVEITPKP